MKVLKIFGIVVGALWLALLVLGLFMVYEIKVPAAGAKTTFFEIKKGQSADLIASSLEEKGLIRSALGFKIYCLYKGNISDLKEGTYKYTPPMNIPKIVADISSGNIAAEKITIIEGERLTQVAEKLARITDITYDDFMNETTSSAGDSWSAEFDFLADKAPDANLEGYIFPDTYIVEKGETAHDFVKEALENFGNKIIDIRSGLAPGESLFETLIMASIVEREAKFDEDRAKIAGIYYNRLRAKQKLQADPTIQFAKGNWEPISERDYYETNSKYNTYLYLGLPPGPIASPGLKSLEAAANPAHHQYFFFFHLKDGTATYSRNVQEHEQNLIKYRNER